MAVTPGIPPAGNQCSRGQQTRRSRGHKSFIRGEAALMSPARRLRGEAAVSCARLCLDKAVHAQGGGGVPRVRTQDPHHWLGCPCTTKKGIQNMSLNRQTVATIRKKILTKNPQKTSLSGLPRGPWGYRGLEATTWVPMVSGVPRGDRRVSGKVKFFEFFQVPLNSLHIAMPGLSGSLWPGLHAASGHYVGSQGC